MEKFIESLVRKIQPLEEKRNKAWWNLATTGDAAFAEELKTLEAQIKEVYSSKEAFLYLKSIANSSDPLIERQRVILLNHFAENQIPLELIQEIAALDSEIETIYTNFRATVDGHKMSGNEVKEVLVKSLDSKERERVWTASKKIGEEVEDKVLKLVSIRNKAAHELGYDNYYSMRLKLQELDEKWLFSWLKDLDEKLEKPYSLYKKELDIHLAKIYGLNPNDLMPWHYHDPFFQEAPDEKANLDQYYKDKDIAAISKAFYQSIALPVDDILMHSDLYERENKNQHAFCTCINRGQDIRILCNLKDNEYWMATQLHELGHAVYDKYIDPNLPFILRTFAHTNMTEAIAMLFGRLSKKPAWISKFVSNGNPIEAKGQDQLKKNLLVFARWALVMIHFEKALYTQKSETLNKTWWDLVEKYQQVKRPPDRDSPDWAAKLHLACAPVYYQNYLIGEAMASQISHYLFKNGETYFTEEMGRALKDELFHHGAKYNWQTTLKNFTKEPLSASYLLNDIN